ncbi:hypothetical protein GUJ93_ZPchr0004g39339 [Zizania palustris]|uniref:Uncharacterized protein n=1 Tax=Zizania palustris TaxID=103762 RepID=A0A8J5VYE5_ZIZPA|nr:hypothetical protein GUJ93_ZPchr0004g39339 [Zizania palustris]
MGGRLTPKTRHAPAAPTICPSPPTSPCPLASHVLTLQRSHDPAPPTSPRLSCPMSRPVPRLPRRPTPCPSPAASAPTQRGQELRRRARAARGRGGLWGRTREREPRGCEGARAWRREARERGAGAARRNTFAALVRNPSTDWR